MGPLRLVPLLTSLQMLLLRAAVTDLPPPPPAISVTPRKSEYLIGDTVSMQCVAPGSKDKLQGFQFAGTSGWAVNIRTPRRACVYSFNITGPKDGGAHLCTYTLVNKARRPVRSQESEAIVINVRDHPPQPTLALKSSTAVTVEGQPLLFLCAAPAGDSERRFSFYNGKAEVADGTVVASGAAEAQLRVPGSHRRHTGNFTCGYEEKTEGRWIPSYRSRAVRVLVREAALAPRLGVDPPTGVVGEDYPLHLTCEASRDDFTLRFRFYRNGLEISPGQAGSKLRRIGNFSEFFFPRIPKSFGGNFSCAAEEDVGGTWVPTPRSEAVGVTVKAPPSQPALLLDPPSGDVIDGDPLGLTCAAAGPAAPRKFAFYKDGVQQFAATAAAERFRFTIPAAEARRAGGRFTCRYEEKVSDWWIPSPLSEAMTVTTQARPQLIPLVAGCAAGAAMLVLGLLLAVCLYVIGHLRSSLAVIGHLGSPLAMIGRLGCFRAVIGQLGSCIAVIGHLGSFLAVIGHLGPSLAVIGHLGSSLAMIGQLKSSIAMIGQLGSSLAVIGHLGSSRAVIGQRRDRNVGRPLP